MFVIAHTHLRCKRILLLAMYCAQALVQNSSAGTEQGQAGKSMVLSNKFRGNENEKK